MAIDKTKRPLKIPPAFQIYAEEHGLFDLYHRMMQQLIIDRPEDPLDYMINWFKRESDPIPKVAVIGAPASGKHSVAADLAKKLGAVLVKASPHAKSDKEIVNELTDRLRAPGSEPVRRGYVLEDLPKNKRQALLLQQHGISFDHMLILEAPEDILLGRRMGKFIDPETNEIYHKMYDWPEKSETADRLVAAPDASPAIFESDCRYWRREKIGICEAYKNANIINQVFVDQPLSDVVSHCQRICLQPNRSEAPIVPRVILLGPIGSGKKSIAKSLAEKYKMIEINADELLKSLSNDKGSSVGDAIRMFIRENNIDMETPNLKNPLRDQLPSELLVRSINDRLSRIDCQSKGWILYNFPADFTQVETLNSMGHRPNKVFSLELPLEAIIERLTNRMVDPETGRNYHLLWDAPSDINIQERLVKAPADDESIISHLYSKHMDRIATIKNAYLEQEKQHEKSVGGLLINVNGDQDMNAVFEYCESMLIKPIPKLS